MRIELPYRSTIKTGAITECTVWTLDGRSIDPVYQRRSRTGAHGVDIYDIKEPVIIIEYSRSGSGREYLVIYETDGEYKRPIDPDDLPKSIRGYLNYMYPNWRYF